MSISKITASLASGTNETTLALINFNVDFSLLKFEAPKEFSALGSCLSRRRKQMAEEGPVHRTARRLGLLFESLVPNIPNVIRAYGARVSEISEHAEGDEHPDHSTRHGVFSDCAGIDGTSLWAAATSGKSAIAMHLLACMLSRAWSGPQATSIWFQIVQGRRHQLQGQINDGIYDSSVGLSLTVSEDLSRDDLSAWDASTRAFLQIADKAQLRRQKQLMLIVNNVNIPVNQGDEKSATYNRVIEAWETGLKALENLLNGQSQTVSKASVLLGLSSWRLYPNLLVLGERTRTVVFDDPVIQHSGNLTIGLHNPDPGPDEGVY